MTTTTGWHAPPELLRAYTEGRLDAVLGASLERHVDQCADCRAAIRPHVEPPLLDAAWDGVRAGVESRQPPWAIRLACRLGLSEPKGLLLAAAASLRVAWLAGSVVALGFAALAAALSDLSRLWPFLLVAPLIPVLGVAVSYGPADDPFEALAVTTPHGRARLILLRTIAVLVTSVPVAFLMGFALPGPTWVAAAWLGPALAMLPVMYAIASFTGPRLAGSVVALTWSGVVMLSVRRLPATWPVEADQQLVYLILAVVALAVLFVRSRMTRQIGAAL